ncbi:uncharacterized protein LOC115741899 [Rhodamnia argentea]|uniref:Uncharacterized protein LOC115741899 n=1 Tax=Rhodamnia argentea TaxID=178133 RepID=A0A8B8PAT9_9MYRT|nr:uncharacterized protein LOC115741899 [Rhodamnia argentea]
MAGATSRKISAAAARAHTRKSKPSSFRLPSGIFQKLLLVSFTGFLAWAYQAIQPPQPKIPGYPGGPPVTAPRIKLRDGRHLAYKEHGAQKDVANFKIVYVHGLDGCRHDAGVATTLSQKVIDDLGVYIVSFDRPGYGQSDPDPKRTMKSIALDIEELADQLGLGSKFYLIGFSMGGQIVWSCLKYIPHRLAGAALLAPSINYWWSGFPANMSSEAYNRLLQRDQWALRVAHYTPWLTYWWNTQKLFPCSSYAIRSTDVLSPTDKKIFAQCTREDPAEIGQQGEFESIHRDLMIAFGMPEFTPMDLENPFPNNEGTVHVWQGDDDMLVPVTMQRFISQQLPWIQYHELPEHGHFFPYANGMSDVITKVLLLGETAE